MRLFLTRLQEGLHIKGHLIKNFTCYFFSVDQLHVLGEQIGVQVFSNRDEKNPVKIAEAAIRQAKENGNSVVLIDTAGRLAIDEVMMKEIAELKKAVKPNEILFVVDSMTGQDAVNTAKAFNDQLDFDGVILTKMDGDTRGVRPYPFAVW